MGSVMPPWALLAGKSLGVGGVPDRLDSALDTARGEHRSGLADGPNTEELVRGKRAQ